MKVPDAAAIAGQLADEDRRRVFAALVLGARSLDDVVARSSLSPAVAAKALGRLVDAGLVVRGSKGELHLLETVFRDAAREALARPESTEHEGMPPETAKVMKAFVRDGRLVQIPTSGSKRRVILDWLAQDFEPGKRYSEAMVNLILGQRHEDTAALRRYMVDDEFLDRGRDVLARRRFGPELGDVAVAAPTHYERLGVGRAASLEEIRTAYRNVARRLHPDSSVGAAAGEMAAVNEAWRVLSDPGRRAMYDRSLSGDRAVAAAVPAHLDDDGTGDDDLIPVAPPGRSGRFPIWPFALVFVMVAIFIFTAGGLSDDPKPPQPDSLIAVGSCVTVEPNGDVIEAACSAPHDGVVAMMVDFDKTCPVSTETHRDKQGRGWVCVVDG